MNVAWLIFVVIPKWTFLLMWWSIKFTVIGILWLMSAPFILATRKKVAA
jgi:hypothetical protein